MKPFILFTILLSISSLAPGGVPSEMKPKLLNGGSVVIEDDFKAPQIDQKWKIRGKASVNDGTLVLEAPSDPKDWSAISQSFAETRDAAIQLLVKHYGAHSVKFGFMGTNSTIVPSLDVSVWGDGHVSMYVIENIGGKFTGRPLNDAKKNTHPPVKIRAGEWLRVSLECVGEDLLVRINGTEVRRVKDPLVNIQKSGVMILGAGDGAKAAVDEVKVTTMSK